MKTLNPKLAKTSENMGAVLDKAMCEHDFRWRLITNPEEIIKEYQITEKKDIEELRLIISKMQTFVIDRLADEPELKEIFSRVDSVYNRTNSNLKYEEALKRKHQ